MVADDVSAAALLKAVRSADKKLIEAAELFDVYKGKGLEENQKSMAIRVRLQPVDATLTDADITTLTNAVTEQVKKQVGGILR